jgi:hypothetical protein
MKTKILIAIALITQTMTLTLNAQTFTDVTASTNLPDSIDGFFVQSFDFNNDNKIDIIYPSVNGNVYQFFINNGNGTFTDITTSSGLQINKFSFLRFADINKDGLSDIVSAIDSSGYAIMRVYNQVTTNVFTDITSNLNFPNPLQGVVSSLMDFDTDGDIDILIATRVGNRSYKAIRSNLNSGTLSYDTLVTMINLDPVLASNELPNSVRSADFDNDGDEDIVYQRFCGTCGLQGNGNFYGHKFGFIRNDGNGVFVEASGINGIGNFPRIPIVWDYNNDGKYDLVSGSTDNVSNMQGSRVYVSEGNGNGTFTDMTNTTQLYDGVRRYYNFINVTDFNNDSYQDVYAEVDGGSVPEAKLFQNNSFGPFTNVASTYGLNFNRSFLNGGHTWFDYDNDGDVDLFASLNNGILKVMKNNTSGKNWIEMRLYGCATNTDAYGVRVEVKFNGKTVALTPSQGFPYMGSDLHLGLDNANIIDTIAVYWHRSAPLYLTNVNANQKLNIYEVQNGSCFACTNVSTIYNYINVTTYDTVTTFIAVTDTLIIDAQLTGIPAPNNINTIKIYPNPASTHIYIDNGNYANMNGYSVEIRNAAGALVFGSLINQQQFYIDLSSWSGNGTYFVRIFDPSNNVISLKKLIIQ